MEDKTYIILGIVYLILAIILVVVVLVLINKHNKKKLQGILTNLELDKNLIISANILTELNKVGSLINNKNLEIKYNNWKERYKQIKEVDMPSLENKLNDLEALIRDKKYKDFVKDSSKLELEIYYIKSKSDGVITKISALKIGKLSLKLGAGRLNKESIIDYTVGIKLHKNILEQVKKGDILATLYVNDLNLNLTKEDLDIFKIRNK